MASVPVTDPAAKPPFGYALIEVLKAAPQGRIIRHVGDDMAECYAIGEEALRGGSKSQFIVVTYHDHMWAQVEIKKARS